MRTRTLLAILVLQWVAMVAFAQSDNEYGRASGGSIDAITKTPSRFSGSLSLSQSTGMFGGTGYGASLGGEVLKDRLWVFAAASVLPRIHFSNPDLTALDAKVTAQPVDWNTVTASFSQMRQPLFAPTGQPNELFPSSFLSLRSTTLLSDRMMLNISFSRSTGTGGW